MTPAFGDLHAACVIHAVAPDGLYGVGMQQWWGRRQWSGGMGARDVHLEEAPPPGDAHELLAQTYGAILSAALHSSASSVALPAVGSGVLGFAAGLTAKVALGAFATHVAAKDGLRVDVALLEDSAFSAWSKTARALLGAPQSVGSAGIETYEVLPLEATSRDSHGDGRSTERCDR